MTYQDLKTKTNQLSLSIGQNYSVATVNCSDLHKKWFFILFHTLPMAVNFVNFSLQVTFNYFDREKSI